MGDRVLFQAYSARTGDFGAVIYCHWAGYQAPNIIRETIARMGNRLDDIEYTTARMAQIAMAGDREGHINFGIMNATKLLTADDSHGDAGVVLLNVDNGHCHCLGGYLKTDNNGEPVIKTWP